MHNNQENEQTNSIIFVLNLLKMVAEYTYLGMTISASVSFNKHSKASAEMKKRALAALRRQFDLWKLSGKVANANDIPIILANHSNIANKALTYGVLIRKMIKIHGLACKLKRNIHLLFLKSYFSWINRKA